MVFQEQSLLTNLTVGENIYLGNEAQFTRFGIVDWRALYAAARASSPRSASTSTRATRADDLDFASRQMVELAKALTLEEHAAGHLVILLDEPTSVLERAEIDVLFARVRALQGARLLHLRLAPARRGAGALRPHLRHEGRRGRRRAAAGGGRRHRAAPPDGRPQPAGRILPRAAAEALPRRGAARGRGPPPAGAPTATSSFKLHAGEILGIAGVIGSGREELTPHARRLRAARRRHA